MSQSENGIHSRELSSRFIEICFYWCLSNIRWKYRLPDLLHNFSIWRQFWSWVSRLFLKSMKLDKNSQPQNKHAHIHVTGTLLCWGSGSFISRRVNNFYFEGRGLLLLITLQTFLLLVILISINLLLKVTLFLTEQVV